MKCYEPQFSYNDNNKRILRFFYYTVEEKSKNFTAVYKSGQLITSRKTFKSACKVAKLLEQAYIEGYNNGAYDY
jgi:hypothetical protein